MLDSFCILPNPISAAWLATVIPSSSSALNFYFKCVLTMDLSKSWSPPEIIEKRTFLHGNDWGRWRPPLPADHCLRPPLSLSWWLQHRSCPEPLGLGPRNTSSAHSIGRCALCRISLDPYNLRPVLSCWTQIALRLFWNWLINKKISDETVCIYLLS